MEIQSKRKLLRAPPNLTLAQRQKGSQNKNPGVSSCNISRIADKTQRTQFKEEESILKDFGQLINTKRSDEEQQNEQNQQNDDGQENDESEKQLNERRGKVRNDYSSKNDANIQQIYQKYEKALEILMNQSQAKMSQTYSVIKAYQLLTCVIQTIKSNRPKTLKYQLVQNILLNYWKVGTDLFFTHPQQATCSNPRSKKFLMQEKQKEKIIENMKEVFVQMQELVGEQKIKLSKMTVICLIMAKEYFKDKDMGSALEWCEKGFRYCPRFKNTSILLKLHYLKSKIYNEIHANQPELQQIKKCIFYLKNLAQNATQNKQFSHQLMKSLIKRRDQLKAIFQNNTHTHESGMRFYNKSTEKPINTNAGFDAGSKSGSLTKFRKRSISLSKLKFMNEEGVVKSQNNFLTNNKSLGKTLPQDNLQKNPSLYNTMNNQTKKDFLKLDINRKTRLKKKGQTLTVWEKNSEKINFENKITKQLQIASSSVREQQSFSNVLKHQLLQRPNAKKFTNSQNQMQNTDKKSTSKKIDGFGSQSQGKEQNFSKSPLGSTSGNLMTAGKLQTVKDSLHQLDQGQDMQTTSNLKSKLVIASKSDSEIISFISTIQNELLERFFSRNLKFSNNEVLDQMQNQLGENNFGGQGKQSVWKQSEINANTSKAQKSYDFDDNAIEEQSDGSADSFTKRANIDENNSNEKIFYPSLVSKNSKNNEIVTPFGIISQMSLSIHKKTVDKTQNKNNPQLPQERSSYIFLVSLTLNQDEYWKVQLEFPILDNDEKFLNSIEQDDEENGQSDFQKWMLNEAMRQRSEKVLEEDDVIQTILLRQSIQTNIESYLIQKIMFSLSNQISELGYRVIRQKRNENLAQEADQQKENYFAWQRQNIFQWRQKNFQYLQQQLFADDHKLQTEKHNTISNNFVNSFNVQQTPLSDVQLFVIEIDKLQSKRNNAEVNCCQQNYSEPEYSFLITKFQLNNVESYVLYKQTRRGFNLLQNVQSDPSKQNYSSSQINASYMSNSEVNANKMEKINKLSFNEQPVNVGSIKQNILDLARLSISNSFFPKLKYFQVQKRRIQNFNSNGKSSLLQIQSENQTLQNNDIDPTVQDFVIKIIGLQSAQKVTRKKGSVRKSQIIQLHQSLHHSNFMRQVSRFRSNLYDNDSIKSSPKKSSSISSSFQKQNSLSQQESGCKPREGFSNSKSHFAIDKTVYKTTSVKRSISNSSMVKILKKALIQPDYKKSALLMTYFDSISISSFYKIMGERPNYVKLTCFRLKTIYIENEANMNYYYLFELQQREARTRMHKFIIGDKEIQMFLKNLKGINHSVQRNWKTVTNAPLQSIASRRQRHTKTLPQKYKVEKKSISKQQILSDQNKKHIESMTSSKLKTKTPGFESRFQNQFLKSQQKEDDIYSIVNLQQDSLQLKFNQESLTDVMKFITPFFVVKKDYLYTSICLYSSSKMFYFMNKFTIDQQQLLSLPNGQNSKAEEQKKKSFRFSDLTNNQNLQTQRIQSITSDSFPNTIFETQNQNENSDFLSQEIKSKRILCQQSLILQITQNFVNLLEVEKRKKKRNAKKKNSKISHFKQEKTRQKSRQNINSGDKSKKLQRLFSILTIIKISKSHFFTIKLYIPKFQRSYTLTLDKSFLDYFQFKDFQYIFKDIQKAQFLIKQLQKIWSCENSHTSQVDQKFIPSNTENREDSNFHSDEIRKNQIIDNLACLMFEDEVQEQKIIWKKVLSMISIEQKKTEDKVYLIMKIAKFNGFIKDSSFLEFFQKDSKIYLVEMTISRKSENCQYFPKQQFVQSMQGNKIKRGVLTKSSKTTNRNISLTQWFNQNNNSKTIDNNKTLQKQTIDVEQINCHNQQFQKISSIYESKAQNYLLYVQIFKIYEQEEDSRKTRLTNTNSISRHLNRGNQRDQQGRSEVTGMVDNHDSVNMSERESQTSFSEFKSGNFFVRSNTLKNTLKSTIKSINFNVYPKSHNTKNFFIRTNRLKSNYKLLNGGFRQKSCQNSRNQISKINFSFYLNELNELFKYIDENYSEQFNQEYFVLSQMNIGFKILGNIIVQEFKKIKDNKHFSQIHTNVRKPTIKTKQQELPLLQKKLGKNKNAEKKFSKQLSFEDQAFKEDKKSQHMPKQQPLQRQKTNLKPIREPHKISGFTTEKLFECFQNQKEFKKRVLQRLKQFNQRLKEVSECQPQPMDYIKDDQLNDFNKIIMNMENVDKQKLAETRKVNSKDGSLSKEIFTSLHSKLNNSQLIDIHILTNQISHRFSSLFFKYGSLLFLVSNVKSYEIYSVAIKLDEQHPFSFIQILEDKKELSCIKNRLFKYYKNILLLMTNH